MLRDAKNTTERRSSLAWIEAELAALERANLRRGRRTFAGRQGVELELDGRRLVNFATNDYLSLAGDPRLSLAAHAALDQSGCGAAASPLIAGYSQLHAQLEQRLASWEETEAALLFVSGYAANLGTVAALVGPEDVVFSDSANHASIIDGCRLSRAKVCIYPHADVAALATLLSELSPHRRRLIVTDSLFSMDGDAAPLVELVELAERHDAMLLVDEAHATGVFGAAGCGLAEAMGVAEQVDVRIGTLSKALGSAGGFVCGSSELVDWLVNRARPYIFSTAAPPSLAAATLAAIEIVQTSPETRITLQNRAATLRDRLSDSLTRAGWSIGNSVSQIVPVIVGESRIALELAAELRERGLFVPAIRPPSVPAGRSRLRISLSAGHTEEMIERLAGALEELSRNVRFKAR